jgi:HemY protein
MWRFLTLLIILILSVWLGLQIAKDPGLAFFSYQHWSVEMPLWFAILSLLGIILIVYLLLRMVGGVDMLVYRLKNWLQWRRKAKAFSKTNHGILEVIEEHYKSAEHLLLAGISQSSDPIINYLALAYVADKRLAFERRDGYLRKAYIAHPHAEVPIGLVQAELQWHHGQVEQALATLTRIRMIAPKHPAILKLLERVYIHLGDWQSVSNILPALYKSGVVTREQYVLLQKRIYVELLNHAKDPGAVWKTVPRKLLNDPDTVLAYAKNIKNSPELEELIDKALKKSWNAQLLEIYRDIPSVNPKKQLARAESLLKLYPHEPILLCVLGQLSTRQKLWGKARNYFLESLKLAPCTTTYASYGKLLEDLGETAAAMDAYKKGCYCVNSYPSSMQALLEESSAIHSADKHRDLSLKIT